MSKADRMPGGKFSVRLRDTASNRIGADWAKWVKTWRNWFILEIFQREPLDEPDIRLYMPAPENNLIKPLSIVLTDYTESEILAVKELFDAAFDLAIPICKTRDEKAQIAYEAGQDIDKRLYRSVASVFTRPWAVGIDSQSLLQRLGDLPSTGRIIERRNERLRAASADVAEDDAKRIITTYLESTPSEPENVREMGGLLGDSERLHSAETIEDDPASDSNWDSDDQDGNS